MERFPLPKAGRATAERNTIGQLLPAGANWGDAL